MPVNEANMMVTTARTVAVQCMRQSSSQSSSASETISMNPASMFRTAERVAERKRALIVSARSVDCAMLALFLRSVIEARARPRQNALQAMSTLCQGIFGMDDESVLH